MDETELNALPDKLIGCLGSLEETLEFCKRLRSSVTKSPRVEASLNACASVGRAVEALQQLQGSVERADVHFLLPVVAEAVKARALLEAIGPLEKAVEALKAIKSAPAVRAFPPERWKEIK